MCLEPFCLCRPDLNFFSWLNKLNHSVNFCGPFGGLEMYVFFIGLFLFFTHIGKRIFEDYTPFQMCCFCHLP